MAAAQEGGKWSAARPGRTLPPGKTRYPLHRRLGGPQGRSARAENLVPTGIRSRTIQFLICRYTDWATGPTFLYVNLWNVSMQGANLSDEQPCPVSATWCSASDRQIRVFWTMTFSKSDTTLRHLWISERLTLRLHVHLRKSVLVYVGRVAQSV